MSYPAADATKLNGIAAGAEVNVQSDWNQGTTTADDYILNKPTIPAAADGSETKVTAGTNVTVTGAGTTASPYVVNSTAGGGSTTYSVGDFAQGGIVFWVDETGQHGLVAAKEDQSTGLRGFLKQRFTETKLHSEQLFGTMITWTHNPSCKAIQR